MALRYHLGTIKRNEYLDVLKGIAIILVVVGHSVQYGSGRSFNDLGLHFSDPVFKIIYSFHMPLFMVISGFLFWGTVNRHKAWTTLTSRLKSLLVPIIIWQTLYLICLLLFGQVVFSTNWIYSYPSALWFLSSVLICSIMVLIGHVWFNDSMLYFIIVFAVMLFVPENRLNGLHVYMYPYFVIGFLWNKYNLRDFYNLLSCHRKWTLFLLSLFIYLFFFIFYDSREHSIYVCGASLVGKPSIWIQFGIDMARYVYGALGVIITMVGIDLLLLSGSLSSSVRGVLQHLGRLTMGIYILNNYSLLLMLNLPIDSNCFYLLTAIETVVLLTIYSGIVMLVRKSKVAKLLLLGE